MTRMKTTGLDQAKLESQYQTRVGANLQLDLTRGKPEAAQLDLANALDGILAGNYRASDGTDARNYGGLEGLPEARALGSHVLGVDAADVIVADNSSLMLMYLYIETALLFGVRGAASAWRREADERGGRVRFLCPVPGYDRHFAVCEQLDIEMLPVPLGDSGPDMDAVERMVAKDPLIKGIWCVPRHSNPTGCTYSDTVVARFAQLPKIAGANFRIFWDNAYSVHDFAPGGPPLAPLLAQARSAGTEDGVIVLGSTSKITFAGAGIAFLAASRGNRDAFLQRISIMTVGPNKVNQLRHARFLPDATALHAHMQKHAALVKPKFDAVQAHLERDLGGLGIATWSRPTGGYFVSLETQPGCARAVIDLAAKAGVKLTPAGATFPYGRDPNDTNIRIAPTFAPLADVEQAMQVLTLCIRLASARRAGAA